MLFFARGPTLACKRRRWRGLTPGAFFMRVTCRQLWRSRKPPAARLRPSVGPPKTDMLHFHGGANQNQTQILYTHARKSPSEPSEIHRGVNRCTPEYEIACPNRETYTEASIVVHLKSKNPVRTIRKKHQASIVYTHARNSPSEPSDTDTGVNGFTLKNERARPNRQIRTPASIVYTQK